MIPNSMKNHLVLRSYRKVPLLQSTVS